MKNLKPHQVLKNDSVQSVLIYYFECDHYKQNKSQKIIRVASSEMWDLNSTMEKYFQCELKYTLDEFPGLLDTIRMIFVHFGLY